MEEVFLHPVYVDDGADVIYDLIDQRMNQALVTWYSNQWYEFCVCREK